MAPPHTPKVYDQNGEVAGMTEFKPTHPSPISFTFDIPVGTTSLTPYAYCNKHGLYTSPTVTLTGSDVNPSQSSGAVCSMFDCAEEGITYARDADCLAIKACARLRGAGPCSAAGEMGADSLQSSQNALCVRGGSDFCVLRWRSVVSAFVAHWTGAALFHSRRTHGSGHRRGIYGTGVLAP